MLILSSYPTPRTPPANRDYTQASDVGSWQSSSNNSYSKHEDLYLIEKVHDVDDVNFNHAWKRRLHKLTPFLSCLSVLAYSAYLTARIYCTRNAEIVAHKKFLMAWVFVAVELGSAFPMFLHRENFHRLRKENSMLTTSSRVMATLRAQGSQPKKAEIGG